MNPPHDAGSLTAGRRPRRPARARGIMPTDAAARRFARNPPARRRAPAAVSQISKPAPATDDQ